MTTTDKTPGLLSLERLKAISDGVFAIVMTILVLELEVPKNYDFANNGLLPFLGEIEHRVLPYMVSFTLTSVYWVLHHLMLNYTSNCNRKFIWINLLMLFLVSLAPFMTGMRAEYQGQIIVAALFGIVQVANYLVLLAIWYYGIRHLTEKSILPAIIRSMNTRIIIAIFLNIIAVFLASINERLATIIFLCTPFLFIKHETVDKQIKMA